MSGPSWSW